MADGSVSLTGKDTIAIGSRGAALRILADLGDGDTGAVDFPNNLVEGKVGKDGNTIFAFNSTGATSTLTIRVLRGSADDKYLNAELNRYKRDPAAYTLLAGEIVKRIGQGDGTVVNDTYVMNGGIIQKYPVVKENVEGDTEQAVSIWQIFFANNDRAIS